MDIFRYLLLDFFVSFQDNFNKNLRRTVMRYVNLSTILVYRLVSQKVMDRFPDYNSLVQARLMLPVEVKRLENVDKRTPHESTWTPILWAVKLLTLGKNDTEFQTYIVHFKGFRIQTLTS